MTVVDNITSTDTRHRDDFSDPAPGVDITVVPDDPAMVDLLGDPHTRRMLGVLHRRFWSKRRDLLLRRAELDRVTTHTVPVTADRHGIDGVVALRGWDVTDPAVLVDGRAIPGPAFDLTTAIAADLGALRADGAQLIVSIPDVRSTFEARLWSDLVTLAEDRFGLERDTLRVIVEVTAAEHDSIAEQVGARLHSALG